MLVPEAAEGDELGGEVGGNEIPRNRPEEVGLRMKASLRDFLEGRGLGPIDFGMTRQDVERIFGKPEATTLPRVKPVILKYGSLELAFDNDVAVFVGIYFRGGVHLPTELNIDGYFPNDHTRQEEFKEYLYKEGIKCGVREDLTFDTQACLVAGEGVNVMFDAQTRQISSIQCTKFDERKRRLRPC